MESLIDSIVRSLQAGACTAVSKAEDIARLGHARLEIAAAKNRATQLQTQLGAAVYGQFADGQEAGSGEEVASLCGQIRDTATELEGLERDYEELREQLRAEPAADEAAAATEPAPEEE